MKQKKNLTKNVVKQYMKPKTRLLRNEIKKNDPIKLKKKTLHYINHSREQALKTKFKSVMLHFGRI